MPPARRKLTPSHRAAISAGQIARYHRIKKDQGPEPELKRCTKCGKWKDRIKDFVQRRNVLASGEVKFYPEGRCRECAWKESQAARNRNPTKRRANERRYYHERKYNPHRNKTTLPVGPLADFLTEMIHRHGMSAIEIASGEHERRLRSIADREFDTVELRTADRILVGLNCPEQLAILYPHA